MDRAFLRERITATKAAIVALEAAQLALGTDGIQSYTIDTGQTVQKVTKLDLEFIAGKIAGLYNQCATMEARLKGGVTTVVPGW